MASIFFIIICLIRPGMDELETVDVVVSIKIDESHCTD